MTEFECDHLPELVRDLALGYRQMVKERTARIGDGFELRTWLREVLSVRNRVLEQALQNEEDAPDGHD